MAVSIERTLAGGTHDFEEGCIGVLVRSELLILAVTETEGGGLLVEVAPRIDDSHVDEHALDPADFPIRRRYAAKDAS